jgi:hypothetical protein
MIITARLLYTSKYSQLVLMSLKPKEEIGEETHPDNDQFSALNQDVVNVS